MTNMAVAYRGPDGMSQQLRDELVAKFGARMQNKGFVTGYMESARAGQNGGHFADKYGITHAIDIGVDIESDGSGLLPKDALILAEQLRLLGKSGKHPFSKEGYLIHDMSHTTTAWPRIAGAFSKWEWVDYKGASPHSDHIHLTTAGDQQWGETPRLDPAVYNSRQSWGVAKSAVTVEQVAAKTVTGYTRPVPNFIGVSQDWKSNPTANLPANHWIITTFGNYQPNGHTGRDYACAIGTDVYAVGPGRVLWADWATNLPGDDSWAGWVSRWFISKGFAGIVVVIDHGPFIGIYAHLNDTKLNIGDRVVQGQRIAGSGNTGASTGPHLHFEIVTKEFAWGNGMYGRVDPDTYLKMGNVSIVPGFTGGSTTSEAPTSFLEGLLMSDQSKFNALMLGFINWRDGKNALAKAVLDHKFTDPQKRWVWLGQMLSTYNEDRLRVINLDKKVDSVITALNPEVIEATVKDAIANSTTQMPNIDPEVVYSRITAAIIQELKS